MAVIINDFQVEPQATQPEPHGATQTPEETPPAQLNPADIAHVIRRDCERYQRICAH